MKVFIGRASSQVITCPSSYLEEAFLHFRHRKKDKNFLITCTCECAAEKKKNNKKQDILFANRFATKLFGGAKNRETVALTLFSQIFHAMKPFLIVLVMGVYLGILLQEFFKIIKIKSMAFHHGRVNPESPLPVPSCKLNFSFCFRNTFSIDNFAANNFDFCLEDIFLQNLSSQLFCTLFTAGRNLKKKLFTPEKRQLQQNCTNNATPDGVEEYFQD